ncbi:organic cation transporter protein isoform X1 [Cloeon dipterum]|uniref:organic cation transporter protein isoform X1 n=1 Tax=Cloeon dipterum TaxID=197152 RepID=UPI00321FEE07
MDSFEEDDQVVESSPQPDEQPTLELEHALAELGKGGRWLRSLFLLGSIPGVLNALNLVAYVFIATEPRFFCKEKTAEPFGQNFTNLSSGRRMELRNESKSSSCFYTEWNSTNEFSDSAQEPQFHCEEYVFFETDRGTSIVSEWSLVCDSEIWKPMSQVALGVGKVIGSLVFGCISDRMGRKTSFLASSFVYLVAGPAAAFAFHFPAFIFFRIALGAAGAGAFTSAYTIMAESAKAPRRPNLGVLFNMSYAIGFVIAPVLSLAFSGWRPFQMAISVPALLLLLPCWSLPESPRWLISQGRHREALYVVRHATTKNIDRQRTISSTENRFQQQEEDASCWSGTLTFLARLGGMLSDGMFRKRLLLSQLIWFSCSLTYHTLMLSGAALGLQPHRYVVLLASVEVLSYLLPPLMLKRYSRRICLALLLTGSTLALATLACVPKDYSVGTMAAAMLSRFFISGAYSVAILFTSELFPTVTRNTAIGTCTTFAQIGSISAPFLVDMIAVGSVSTPMWVCFSASFAALFLSLGLPALRNINLCDTMAQARCSEAELKEVSFFRGRNKAGADDIEQDVQPNELSDIPEEEESLDLSHLGLG